MEGRIEERKKEEEIAVGEVKEESSYTDTAKSYTDCECETCWLAKRRVRERLNRQRAEVEEWLYEQETEK